MVEATRAHTPGFVHIDAAAHEIVGYNPDRLDAHLTDLYDFSGQPWKTQARVREIANDYYSNQPNGIAGNEDCGQMSAWYVFTAIGFCPVNPVSGDYMIGSPLFTKLTLALQGGRRFVIAAPRNSPNNLYI